MTAEDRRPGGQGPERCYVGASLKARVGRVNFEGPGASPAHCAVTFPPDDNFDRLIENCLGDRPKSPKSRIRVAAVWSL
jgi:hypothetical protein